MHMVINKTNQILDFDERHCINEYKSAYVLRCRSTINGELICNIRPVGIYIRPLKRMRSQVTKTLN